MHNSKKTDEETAFLRKFQQEGKKLAHLCFDWDFMAIHAEMDEIQACSCDFATEADNILRDEKANAVTERLAAYEQMKIFDADMKMEKERSEILSKNGASAHSGEDLK